MLQPRNNLRASRQLTDLNNPRDPQQEPSHNKDDADAGLLNALRGCEAGAFNQLIERHERRLLTVAFKITMNREDAEDAVQCTFLKAFKCIHNFRGDSQLSTWLTSIAINEALMTLRKRKRTMISIDEFGDGEANSLLYQLRAPDHTPEDNYLRAEARNSFGSWLKNLSTLYRRAAELHFISECSSKEIALILGISQSAVKARLCRIRRDLLTTGRKHFRSRSRDVCLLVTERRPYLSLPGINQGKPSKV